jgi:hypothetical protein
VKLLTKKNGNKCESTNSSIANAGKPKFTVEDVIGKSKYSSTRCRRCGKTQGWVARNSLSFRHYGMCDVCFDNYVNYLNSPRVKSCDKCGYFEKNIQEEENNNSLLTYFDPPDVTFKCRKFGFEIIPKKLLTAQKCSGFITKKEYAEKCLTGEINPKAQNLVVCEYCKSPYDLFKYTRCPHCGGSAKIPTA